MNGLSLAWAWFTAAAQWHGSNGIPTRLLEHLAYSGVSLLIASAVALPIGMFIGHTGRGAFLAINSANAARALPTIGLLMLAVTAYGLGFEPVLIPLIALAIPPTLVNTFEGIRSVDPDLIAAAEGMGMTDVQVLLRVEIPVALPMIILGLRYSAIQIVSTATIAAFVGLGGLGRYITDGLARSDYQMVLGGALITAVLAMCTEAVFVVLGRLAVSPGIRDRDRAAQPA
ncbi:MAG: osmoprotectant transport system permease protein [Streptomyces sp.]|nr:osmoprotectant transport system permease protein [Streptomyces sp.]